MEQEQPRERYLCWADFSLREVVEGRARGNRRSLWLRARMQTFLFKGGCYAQTHSVQVIMIGLLFLVAFSLCLYKAKVETNVEKLWMKVGGRLEEELAYSKAYGYDYKSYEVVIQTPRVDGRNVLTKNSMLTHAEVLKKAMKVEVEVFEQTWSIQDICAKPSVPQFNPWIDKMMEKLIPCTVITPLDCFWDGAKIHPQNITNIILKQPIQWTTFDPTFFVNHVSSYLKENLDITKMKSVLTEAGISHGYLNKPCLNPNDPRCPNMAPNKKSRKALDIGEIVTGGCTGFAEKMMIWPEEMIIGGTRKNKSGYIKRAHALQSVINLMSEEEIHQWWRDANGFTKDKVQHLAEGWTVEAAKRVLNTWQRKFVQVVNDFSEEKYTTQKVMAFSTTSFNDLLNSFSKPNLALIIGGYSLMILYACFTMVRCNSVVQSQGCMGILGVLLVSLSVAAGLGLCSLAGIDFNVASTQVLPFLALGLGVDDMFLLSHAYRDLNSKNLRTKEYAGYCLSTTGVSIMLTSITNAAAFFFAAIIPIPALRALCIKAGVVIIFNFFSIVIIYPAMIAIDVKRREDDRYDIFCCVKRDTTTEVTHLRPETSSSLATYNETTDDDYQIASSANVTLGQSQGYILPGVALRASANCNINNTICKSMLGGNVMSLPEMGNFVVSVSSSGQIVEGDSSQNANAKINANYKRGKGLDINASSSAICSRHNHNRKSKNIPSKINHGCSRENLDNTQNFNAQSKVNVAMPPRKVSPIFEKNPQQSEIHVTADASAHSEGSCSNSTNAEVILRPNNIRRSRQRSVAWERTMNSKLVKTITRLSVGDLTKTYYTPLLKKNSVKIFVLILFAIVLSISIYGFIQVQDGVDLTDVVPKESKLAEFLKARNEHFSFYDIFIITKANFDYPNNQEMLTRLHEAFKKVDFIVKERDKKLPKFWLIYFRDWLISLQKAFDKDWENGAITYTESYPNATSDGKLARRLLLGTGEPQETSQLQTQKLVRENGIINERGFYSFLRAWYRMDPMGYESSLVKIKPSLDDWNEDDDKRRVRPAEKIKYARMPFYVNGLKETSDYVKLIKQVRAICDRFTAEGLPSYPRGAPFTFWEQYIWLRWQLLITVSVVLAASFLIISTILVNIWAGTIVVVILALTTIELFGFLGLAGIKLSAIPAVTLVFSVGVGVEFTVHLCMVFVSSVGTRVERTQQALDSVITPVVNGAVSTILSVVMLAGSEFDFVVKYFFHVLALLILIGFFNGVVLLPVILSLIGPNPEVVPIPMSNFGSTTTSWIGLTSFDRNACSSTSNLTTLGKTETSKNSLDTDYVTLQNMENCTSKKTAEQLDGKKGLNRKDTSPKQFYGKTLPSLTESKKAKPSRNIAEVTATATVTVKLPVELKQEKTEKCHDNQAIIPHHATDLKVLDLEEEYV